MLSRDYENRNWVFGPQQFLTVQSTVSLSSLEKKRKRKTFDVFKLWGQFCPKSYCKINESYFCKILFYGIKYQNQTLWSRLWT